MCEVSDEHRLQRKTFHMGVNYLDAYMAYLSHEVTLATFQLLAISCLFVAAKIEETISAPSLSNLVEFALQDDENKTAEDRPKKLADISKQYIEIEVKLMTIFDWDVLIPSTIDTLWGCFERHRMLTACRLGVEFVDFDMNGRQHVDAELFSQAASLLDHAVCDVESLKFSNSQLASCAFYRAVMSRESLFDYPSISVDVELVTGFTLVELEECLKFMDGFSISHITELVEARLAAMADQQRVLGLDPTNILYSQVNPFEVDAEDLQGDEQDDFGKG
ncbi:hypothetical protein BC831DRAFT_295945 [Entophlyctis helioformis]|nr:hypothetical protein BC831DRAFT_295945 [Entophlyctis helioformis]